MRGYYFFILMHISLFRCIFYQSNMLLKLLNYPKIHNMCIKYHLIYLQVGSKIIFFEKWSWSTKNTKKYTVTSSVVKSIWYVVYYRDCDQIIFRKWLFCCSIMAFGGAPQINDSKSTNFNYLGQKNENMSIKSSFYLKKFCTYSFCKFWFCSMNLWEPNGYLLYIGPCICACVCFWSQSVLQTNKLKRRLKTKNI